MNNATRRLDAFTDAAFAFALTLFVAGGDSVRVDAATLQAVVSTIPAFAIGFAIIAMFWHAHVRWRELRGEGDWRSKLLTLAMVFAVLAFVQPLRAMSASFADFLTGNADGSTASLGQIFATYGVGFVTMSLLTLALTHDGLRRPDLDRLARHDVRGEMAIWAILAATGIVSVLIALGDQGQVLAPMAYATLPVTIGGFSWWWYGKHRTQAENSDDVG